MTNAVTSRIPRHAIRIAGTAAILLGGWCCWMALRPVPDAEESAAFRDWHETPTQEARATNAEPPRRLAAAITDVMPVGAVESEIEEASVIFAEFEHDSEEAPSIEPVGHLSKPQVPAASTKKGNSVWLTGTIEDDETAEKK